MQPQRASVHAPVLVSRSVLRFIADLPERHHDAHRPWPKEQAPWDTTGGDRTHMKRSTERILTTHTGSLPRTAKVIELLLAEQQNHGARKVELDAAVAEAIAHVVEKQIESGIDVINDGEQGRTDYTVHVLDRLAGFAGESTPPKDVMNGADATELFMTSPSPGQISRYLKNKHYKTEETYVYALADVMKREYKAIVDAGFILQLDCPDLAMLRHTV